MTERMGLAGDHDCPGGSSSAFDSIVACMSASKACALSLTNASPARNDSVPGRPSLRTLNANRGRGESGDVRDPGVETGGSTGRVTLP